MLLAEVLVVALASLAYVMTRNIIWFVLLPLVMVALLVRIVYLLRAHRDEWRWAMNRNP